MHKKQAILDAVSQALDAMGVSSGDMDFYDESEEMTGENKVPIWRELEVSVNDQGRGPIHNKADLFKGIDMSKPPQVDNYGMPVDDQGAEMMTALGMV